MREIIKGKILRFDDVLLKLRDLADRPHIIVNEVNDEERRVYYVRRRDNDGQPLEVPSVTFKSLRTLISKIRQDKSPTT